MRWLMDTEEILRMQSRDAEYYHEQHTIDGTTVADQLTIDTIDDEFHQRIKKVMERDRINLVPVCIINDRFCNGHRRMMIAEELGLEEVLCTDDWMDSEGPDDYIVIGEEE